MRINQQSRSQHPPFLDITDDEMDGRTRNSCQPPGEVKLLWVSSGLLIPLLFTKCFGPMSSSLPTKFSLPPMKASQSWLL